MAKETGATGLHEHAVNAEKELEALATGLAQAGAGDGTVKAVTQMAEVCRQIVTALGKGQESQPDEENPEEEAAPSEEKDQPKSFGQAAGETEQMMAESAAKRK